MPRFPAVNLVAVLVAGPAAFLAGGVYWTQVAPYLNKLLGGPTAPEAMPPLALAVAFVTRWLAAYVLALFIGFAGERSARAGVVIGWLACAGFVLTITLGQAAFGVIPRIQFLVGVPEILLGYTIMGAILGRWGIARQGEVGLTSRAAQ